MAYIISVTGAATPVIRAVSITDPNMVSDVGTGALLANAGAQAAAYNVRINLPHITDQDFEAETHTTLTGLLEECSELAAAVAAEVERSLGS